MSSLILPFLIIFLIYLLDKNTALAYIIGLFLFYNIGGYLNSKALGFPGFFTMHDFGLIYAFIAGFKANNFKIIPKDIYLRRFLRVVLFFTVYQVIVSIVIKLEQPNLFSFIQQLSYHKWRLFGIYFLIPTYYLFQKYPKKTMKYMLYLSFIVLTVYFITLFTPLELITVNILERNIGSVVGQRMYYPNPGFSLYFINITIIILLVKIRLNIKPLIILSGSMGFIYILLTITRQSIVSVSGIILIIFYLLVKYQKLEFTTKSVKMVFTILLLILIFSVFFTNTANSLFQTFKLSFMELTGKIEEGTTQGRSGFELPIMLEMISKKPIFGHGFLYDFFGSYHTKYEIGLADIPFLGNISLYGLFGFILFLFRYIVILKSMILLKRKYLKFVKDLNKYHFIFLVFSISLILGRLIFTFFNFSKELVNMYYVVGAAISFGIFYGMFNILRKQSEKNNIYH